MLACGAISPGNGMGLVRKVLVETLADARI